MPCTLWSLRKAPSSLRSTSSREKCASSVGSNTLGSAPGCGCRPRAGSRSPERVVGVQGQVRDAVAERDHAALKRDGFVGEALGEALAVKTLVHVQDGRGDRVGTSAFFSRRPGFLYWARR